MKDVEKLFVDTNIVATMQAYNITHLLTHNIADFQRFEDHITVVPLEPDTPSSSGNDDTGSVGK